MAIRCAVLIFFDLLRFNTDGDIPAFDDVDEAEGERISKGSFYSKIE